MLADYARRRVLVVAENSPQDPLSALFGATPLGACEAVPADGFPAARFVLQHHPCDILLVDEPVYRRDGAESFDWLARRHELPAVVLTEDVPEQALRAYEHGVTVWLPRGLALPHPELLAVALERAAGLGELQRSHRRLEESLQQCRRQVDRLVSLLWRTLPLDADRRWLSQRQLLERLREELLRAQRYQNPLTVALGEVEALGEGAAEALADWAAERIVRGKRTCDVVGQYGPRGFLVLLVNTPAEGGVVCCRRLQKALEEAQPACAPHVPVRAYFGVAGLAVAAATPQGLLRRAEEHLEAARSGAPGRLVSGLSEEFAGLAR
jgi:diguanylate cyclase